MAIPTKSELKMAFLERIQSAKGQDFAIRATTFANPEETIAKLAPSLLKAKTVTLRTKTKSPWYGLH